MNLYEIWFKNWKTGEYMPYLIEADSAEAAIQQCYSQVNSVGSVELITQN